MKFLGFLLMAAQIAMAALSLTPSKNEGGIPVIILQNTSETCSFSAYIVDFQTGQEQGHGWSRTIVDSVLSDKPVDPIPPKGSKEIGLPLGESLNSIQAAALCGSDRAGDPKLAELLVQRRAGYRTDLVKARVLVRKLRAEQADYQAALKAFQDWRAERLRRNPVTDPAKLDINEMREQAMKKATEAAVSELPSLLATRIKKQGPSAADALASVDEYLDGLDSRLNSLTDR
jgi:hypothetical protein